MIYTGLDPNVVEKAIGFPVKTCSHFAYAEQVASEIINDDAICYDTNVLDYIPDDKIIVVTKNGNLVAMNDYCNYQKMKGTMYPGEFLLYVSAKNLEGE